MSNYAIRERAGTPSNGTTAVFTLTISGTPAGGTYRLGAGSRITSALAYNASNTDIQTALRALSSIGAGNVTVTGGGTPFTMTMSGTLVKTDFGPIYVANSSLTGGSSPLATVAETTPGVTATERTAPFGCMLVDSTTGLWYKNTSTTVNAPAWTRMGARHVTNLYLPLADITAATLYTYTPAIAGRIISIKATVETVSSTTTKAATLTWSVAGTPTTGGALALTTANTNAKGAVVAGSAITAANSFTNAQALTLVGSSVTAFIEGSVWVQTMFDHDLAPV